MFLSDSKAEFLQSTDHKLFRGLLFQVKKLRLQTDSQTFLLHICKFIQRRHVLFIMKKSFQMQEFLINSACLFIQLFIIQKTSVESAKQKASYQKTFLKRSTFRHFYFFLLFFLRHFSGKQAFQPIVLSVLPIQLITGKIAPCDLIPTKILPDQILRDLNA